MSEPFNVGDKVSWLGEKCTVREVDHKNQRPVCIMPDNDLGVFYRFFSDGRLLPGQRPSLKHIKKRKVRYESAGWCLYYGPAWEKLGYLYKTKEEAMKCLHRSAAKECFEVFRKVKVDK